jgi:hypothetical protein
MATRTRALLGWMTEEQALLALAGRRLTGVDNPEFKELARQKRLVAAARPQEIRTNGVATGLPGSLRSYAAKLAHTREGANLSADGFAPALIDLRHVCALAPTARADLDLPAVEAGNLEALAEVTLQPPGESQVDARYNRELRVWTVVSPDHGVGVLGSFDQPGPAGFALGLVIGHSASFVQAVRVTNRFVLIDGYDRALSLLARGIDVVPAYVRLHARGLSFRSDMLEREAVLGRRPPLLSDFLDDDVSADVPYRPLQRMLVVRAVEYEYTNPD